jgi:hypothetical protein
MTVITHSPSYISGELAQSRERDSSAESSRTSSFPGNFVAPSHVIGSFYAFYAAPHPFNSPVLVACGDVFDPSQPRAVLQCP